VGVVEGAVVLVEVEGDTSKEKGAQAGGEGLPWVLVAAERCLGEGGAGGCLDHAEANWVGTNLEPSSLLVEDTVLLAVGESSQEVDRLASVAGEVVRADNTSLTDDVTRERREDWDGWLVEGNSRGNLLERLHDWLDLGRVEGEWNVKLGGLETLGRQSLVGSADNLDASAENGLLWAVDAGDLGHLWAKSVADSLDRALDSKHAVGVRSAVLDKELSAATDQENHVRSRDDTSNVKSGVLSERVTDNSGWGDTPGSPHASKSDLNTSHTELDLDWRESRNVSTVEKLEERWETLNAGKVVKLVNVVLEAWQVLVELLAETSVLGTLASEAEGSLGGDHGDWAVGLLDLSIELLADLADLSGGEGNTVVVLDATSSQSVRHAWEGCLRVLGQPSLEVGDLSLEGGNGAGGDGDRECGPWVNTLWCLAERTVLDEEGGVTTSGREVVQEQLTLLSTVTWPGNLLLGDVDVALSQVLRERLVDDTLDTDVGWDGVVLHHHQNLGKGVDTGSSLSVTDVGLDGTEVELLLWSTATVARSEGVGDRGHLNTITSLGTGTVHLNVRDLVSVNTSVSEDLLEKVLLGTSVRVGDGDGLSGVVGSGTKNATKDVVLVGNGVLVSLEDNGTSTVTTAVTVGVVVVGLARTGLGQELTLGQTRENVWVGQDVETTSTGSVTVTSPERVACNVDGSERRRAGSVNREGWTAELEVVVDATWSEGTYTTGDEVRVDVLGGVDLTPVIGGLTVESTDTVQLGGWSTVCDVTRHFEGLVSGDKGKTTHWVSLSSLTRRHVEELWVEKTWLVDEATEWGVGLVLALSRWVAVSISVETVGWDSAVNVESLLEELPESLVGGGAWETTGQTDNGDLVVLDATLDGSIVTSVLPGRLVDDGNFLLATSLQGRDERVGDVVDAHSEDLGWSAGVGGDLADGLLEEEVPANLVLEHVGKGHAEELESVLGGEGLAGSRRVNERGWLVGLEDSGDVIAQDAVDIGIGVKVSSVVWSVNWDSNAGVLANSLGGLEETLGGGWRTADGNSHGTDSADPGLVEGRDTGLLVEGIKRSLNVLLGDTSNNS